MNVSTADINLGETPQQPAQEEPSDASLLEKSKDENVGVTDLEEHVKGKPEHTAFVIKPEDEEILITYFGAEFKDKLLEFHQNILSKPTAKPAVFGSLLTPPITDRVLRGRMHGDVRRIFESRLETEVSQTTCGDNCSKT